jgi:hypothetical protein
VLLHCTLRVARRTCHAHLKVCRFNLCVLIGDFCVLTEIVALGRSSKKDVGRCYKLIISATEENGMKTVSGADLLVSCARFCNIQSYLCLFVLQRRFVNNLQLSPKDLKAVLNLATVIVTRAKDIEAIAG